MSKNSINSYREAVLVNLIELKSILNKLDYNELITIYYLDANNCIVRARSCSVISVKDNTVCLLGKGKAEQLKTIKFIDIKSISFNGMNYIYKLEASR